MPARPLSPRQPRVAVVGSLHYDILVTGGDRPRRGETVLATGWAWKCGGKGGNQAIEAARHGARTAFVGATGRDAFGETLLARLAAAGVDTSCVARLEGHGSGMSVAIFDAGGDYGAVIVPGSNWAIPEALIDESPALASCDVLLLQNEIRPETSLRAARIARAAGARVVLNAAPARDLPDALAAEIDLLVVNEIEAGMLAGADPLDGPEAALAAAAVLQARVPRVVVTLGGRGLVVAERDANRGDGTLAIPGHSVRVASTHGAGDAFIGALAVRLAEGAPLAEAARYGNAAAAALVSTPEADRAALTATAARRLLTAQGS